ncbi:hypothetical protein [Pseudosulfitobacter koreensis]|uniref:Plastocyanin n=1 Tax=Pseudosulfitobacter koreensis TaxID=2968472 RepID=A0ABT1YZA3_9RHOB|nr:hypothetical protein [Pseudosulfitobacter koreense]MCR8826223.1 hypothetical protein [Pseudosulfitobacter koreense]
MLHSIKVLAIAASFSAVLAPAAHAEGQTHTVMVLGAAFFPQITYVTPGDVVNFVNATETEQSIVAQDDGWSVGPLAAQGEQSVLISDGMATDFFIVDTSAEGAETGEAPASGSISFNSALLRD